MASLNITHTFTNGTVADALQVNQNFNNIASHVNTNLVNIDGSVKAGVGALDFALTGIIVPYVGVAAPTGWLLCQGQAVSKTTYAALYAVVGVNAFGTDTGTDFYLPNLQGRVPVGVSTTDTDFDRADTGGVKSVLLTSSQSGVPAHAHTINGQMISVSQIGGDDAGVLSGTITSGAYYENTQNSTPYNAAEAHTNLQPYIALNYIVKV